MGRKTIMLITLPGAGEVLEFAASELAKYLLILTGLEFNVDSVPTYEPEKPDLLWLGRELG